MATVTIHSDLEPKEIKSVTVSTFSPSICHEVMEPDVMISGFFFFPFLMLNYKTAFSLSSFLISSRESLVPFPFLSLEWHHLHIWGCCYLWEILIPACDSSSLAVCMLYSVRKVNKQGDNIQTCPTPFPILNQSIVPSSFLTIASWPAHRFLSRQIKAVWYSINSIGSVQPVLQVCGMNNLEAIKPAKTDL